jgi:hypothetical protein
VLELCYRRLPCVSQATSVRPSDSIPRRTLDRHDRLSLALRACEGALKALVHPPHFYVAHHKKAPPQGSEAGLEPKEEATHQS